jgi:ribosomal-protein-alanine N-acetyltransferase
MKSGYQLRQLRERGVLIGYAVWMPVYKEAHLLNITLAPQRQGHGLGTWMMRSVMKEMLSQGLEQILLEVRPSNHRALALYRRLGFAQIGIRKGYYPALSIASAAREDAVVMRRVLEA